MLCIRRLAAIAAFVLASAAAAQAGGSGEIAATNSPEPRLQAPASEPSTQAALALTFQVALVELAQRLDAQSAPKSEDLPERK